MQEHFVSVPRHPLPCSVRFVMKASCFLSQRPKPGCFHCSDVNCRLHKVLEQTRKGTATESGATSIAIPLMSSTFGLAGNVVCKAWVSAAAPNHDYHPTFLM